MKFSYKLNEKFIFDNNLLIIIEGFNNTFNYLASTEPNKNYIIGIYEYSNIHDKNSLHKINNRCFEFCINMCTDDKYTYLINERQIKCNNLIMKIKT